jgi:hypothetical protein
MLKRQLYRHLFILPVILLSALLLTGNRESAPLSSISDGPYVFWEGENVSVYYVASGEVKQRRLDAAGKSTVTVRCPEIGQVLELSPHPPEVETAIYPAAEKVFAVSDIHGQYQSFIRLLKVHKIIGKNLRWSFGKGHLVVNGDVFDRGPEVTESLWLIHQLARQAKKSGGRVHLLLGNHEVMVLQGDLRYLHLKYQAVAKTLLKREMNELYGKSSELGRWLRTRHTIIKIGRVIFVHAGIHPYFVANKYTIESINDAIRADLDTPRDTIRADRDLSFLFRGRGPLWYRGFFMDTKTSGRLGTMHIKLFQSYFGVHCIVVGHTTRKHVHPLFGKRVIAIDSGFKYGDRGEGLLLDMKKQKAYRATMEGKLILLKKIKKRELDHMGVD